MSAALLDFVRGVRGFFEGLAGRLLAFTAAVVLFAELLIFAPTVAAFHELRVRDRINLAQTAALALEAAPELAAPLQVELLENAEVRRIAMRREGARELLLDSGAPHEIDALVTFDYRNASVFTRFGWAFGTLFAQQGRVLRVMAEPRFETGDFIEIVFNEAPLKREVMAYAGRLALASTAVSALAGACVYTLLTWFFVRPARRLTQRIERFRDAPEDASIFSEPPRGSDEIARADRAAADMAGHVRASLRQREHLASLGAAMARIAHDLRNALSTAQLVAERLGRSEDPGVRQAAPRLERAIGRAAGLAAAALRYGKSEEAAPVLKRIDVRGAIEEAFEDALAGYPALARRIEAQADLAAIADSDHVHRILVNLVRNAAQAVAGGNAEAPDAVVARAERRDGAIVVAIRDKGPGVREAARERLFEAFVSADRADGAGLGLAIARELARAQGGDVQLAATGPEGSVFEITLPSA
ncbi:MAG: HAMP domain-containing histidine kinase [Hyphomonadaceae bacterium]|nr:HAMP domain-containing histidine kinase [Hyphomonadaceae bacterium]